jgi:hypothetical protein
LALPLPGSADTTPHEKREEKGNTKCLGRP